MQHSKLTASSSTFNGGSLPNIRHLQAQVAAYNSLGGLEAGAPLLLQQHTSSSSACSSSSVLMAARNFNSTSALMGAALAASYPACNRGFPSLLPVYDYPTSTSIIGHGLETPPPSSSIVYYASLMRRYQQQQQNHVGFARIMNKATDNRREKRTIIERQIVNNVLREAAVLRSLSMLSNEDDSTIYNDIQAVPSTSPQPHYMGNVRHPSPTTVTEESSSSSSSDSENGAGVGATSQSESPKERGHRAGGADSQAAAALHSISVSRHTSNNTEAALDILGTTCLERRINNIPYFDASRLEDPDPITFAKRRARGGVPEPFPEKLYRILTDASTQGHEDIVSFCSHGRAFAIHNPERFVKDIMPRYFPKSRLSSFNRQLNLYGLTRINTGLDSGGYYHELFLRGRPAFCSRIRRVVGVPKVGVLRRRGVKAFKASVDPKFYDLPEIRVQSTPAPSKSALIRVLHDLE